MIDLHMHSTVSDGTDSPLELLQKAEKLELSCISITDHESCLAYSELETITISDFYSGKIIKGIEIKSFHQGMSMDVLGYHIDTDKMEKWIEEYYIDKSHAIVQQKYFDQLYKAGTDMELVLPKKEEIDWNPSKDWAAVVMYGEIRKYNENEKKVPKDLWEDLTTFSKKYCVEKQSPFYLDKSGDYPTLGEVIEVIKSCGGLVFLPHIFLYQAIKDKKAFINTIVDTYSIDGLECYHSDFTKEESNYLLELCNKKGLYKSGGSDYHGEFKTERKLGFSCGGIMVGDAIINDWVDKK